MSKTIYVDVDGTNCTNHSLKNVNPEEFKDIQSDYENAEPHRERIDYINFLYEKGNKSPYHSYSISTVMLDNCPLTGQSLCLLP